MSQSESISWERQAIDEIIEQECYDVYHSPTGTCPCCGVELTEENHVSTFDDGGEFDYIIQRCYSCGWESGEIYE